MHQQNSSNYTPQRPGMGVWSVRAGFYRQAAGSRSAISLCSSEVTRKAWGPDLVKKTELSKFHGWVATGSEQRDCCKQSLSNAMTSTASFGHKPWLLTLTTSLLR